MSYKLRNERTTDLPAHCRIGVAAFADGLHREIYPNGRSEADIVKTYERNSKILRGIQAKEKKDEEGHDSGVDGIVEDAAKLEIEGKGGDVNEGEGKNSQDDEEAEKKDDDDDGSEWICTVAYDPSTPAPPEDFEYPSSFEVPDDGIVPEDQRGTHHRVVGVAAWQVQPSIRTPEQLLSDHTSKAPPPPTANAALHKAVLTALATSRAKHLPQLPHMMLQSLAVDPEYQRKGIGALLLRQGFEIAREREIEEVWLEGTEKGKGLYLKEGFRVLEKMQGFNLRDFGGDREVGFWVMRWEGYRKEDATRVNGVERESE